MTLFSDGMAARLLVVNLIYENDLVKAAFKEAMEMLETNLQEIWDERNDSSSS